MPTPCWHRSTDNNIFYFVVFPCLPLVDTGSLINVVFPLPVGPVKTVSSPGRWPLMHFVRSGNRFHCKMNISAVKTTMYDSMCTCTWFRTNRTVEREHKYTLTPASLSALYSSANTSSRSCSDMRRIQNRPTCVSYLFEGDNLLVAHSFGCWYDLANVQTL